MYMSMNTCTCTCMHRYTCTCINVHVNTHVHTYMYMYMYIHMYLHAHTHTYMYKVQYMYTHPIWPNFIEATCLHVHVQVSTCKNLWNCHSTLLSVPCSVNMLIGLANLCLLWKILTSSLHVRWWLWQRGRQPATISESKRIVGPALQALCIITCRYNVPVCAHTHIPRRTSNGEAATTQQSAQPREEAQLHDAKPQLNAHTLIGNRVHHHNRTLQGNGQLVLPQVCSKKD